MPFDLIHERGRWRGLGLSERPAALLGAALLALVASTLLVRFFLLLVRRPQTPTAVGRPGLPTPASGVAAPRSPSHGGATG